MRTLVTFLAVAAIAAFGLAGTAQADEFADEVDGTPTNVSALTCCDDPDDALGGPNASGTNTGNFAGFVTIELNGILTLNFKDNLCFEDGNGASPDLRVHEFLGDTETFTVAVGLDGGALSSTVAGNGQSAVNGSPGELIELNPVAAGAFFNQVQITSLNNIGAAPGTDIDAVECFFTLDQLDIEKDFAVNPQDGGVFDEIDVRVKGETGAAFQQFKAFTIKITNDTGINNAFTGLTFFDAVPAEYDLDPTGEDLANDSTINAVCADGNCNGIAEDANGKCTVTADVPQGAKAGHGGNKLLTKLEPELLSIDASALLDTEMCTTTVYVKTDLGAHKKMFTPTSCPVDLNSGVKVFDALKNLLLQDDDQLIFDAGAGTDGTCNDV